MSQIWVCTLELFAYCVFYCRTVAEIQRSVTKQSKQNALSRLLHAKNNKEKVAAWKSDLDKLLQVFQVCSVASTWSLLVLIICSQIQLLLNTNVITSDIHANIVSTQTIVSNIHQGGISTHSVVSELQHNVTNTLSNIHRAVVVKQEGTNNKNSLVGVTSIVLTAEQMLTIT